ncbi:flagellar hook-basal body protein [Allosphingosinicella deserti]|uniref:Flagellar hook-basal body protein n=1 Tax=Allosphingosinicella deserti TaxID=2116704 RepID=A0A2P7QW88_9SPHN|nr:flagellar hook basal-body protein [Sphingomonas deserti]PSJ42214.1 flagellar hook-basal body protein [Sphingomonas deserti]
MNGAFYVGAIGLDAQQRALDTIANNISNVNTPAFKRSTVRFSEMMALVPDGDVVRPDLGASLSSASGVTSSAIAMIDQQGKIASTGNPFDVAVQGRGFIELAGPAGQTLLWRGGTLKVNEDGLLATEQGLPLKAGITIPADVTAIEISSDGTVKGVSGQETGAIELGQISLVKVDDAAALERLDGGLYAAGESVKVADAAAGEDGVGTFVQGAREQSNVELSTEMVQLLLVQRAFAANAQIVQAADQLMALANGLRR